MTPLRFRRPLLIIAAAVAVLSLAAVGRSHGPGVRQAVAPAWITSTALYGLPVAFLLMLVLVVDGVAARRRTREPGR